jgi:MFS superfamily sulfate permease-like transporter
VSALVLDLEGVSDIDTTAIEQLDDLLDDLEAGEVTVAMARVRKPVYDMLDRSGVLARIGEDAIFLEVDDAVEHYRNGDS